MPSDNGALLSVRQLNKSFGGIKALSGVDFEIPQGVLAGLIGPNGSGKTTAFNLVTGVLKPTSGQIVFRAVDVTGNAPERNAELGMARTFQNIRLFRDLPVIDNVMVGLHMRNGPGFWSTVLGLPRASIAERNIRKEALEALEVLGLADKAHQIVANLPYGDQRKVEFARALATKPQLLLLDEPTAGMNPQETADLGKTISKLHKDLSLTVLLVEHDMKMVMGICEELTVINQGKMLASGTPQEIQNNSAVIDAYLGRRREKHDA
ncbi:branched-chain amino acid transport system ATP-binding protein [Breoghania corrubedonensis]|uniref:Branched-chain amino acid transport system ATP-binding protein n=1 Tax=Breoghania corrubedonensis TaxID=665038 RepID=A0A2T5VC64_9HYPH|nr:ABC transporter ATP-binding protein [Breoghania corrubedonensis]PTW61342.1 branched-chain amino acid transport system ATP-binding protein [Breoghania corrubedonensis]